jgi:hypothetical protein
MIPILEFITALRESDKYIEVIYTNGSCYKFHLLLKKLYPESKPCINVLEDHIVTLHEGIMYDINGVVGGGVWRSLTKDDLKVVENWSFDKKMMISLGECQFCEEPILV